MEIGGNLATISQQQLLCKSAGYRAKPSGMIIYAEMMGEELLDAGALCRHLGSAQAALILRDTLIEALGDPLPIFRMA